MTSKVLFFFMLAIWPSLAHAVRECQADLLRDGYQLVTDLPKFEGMPQSDLYRLLVQQFGANSTVRLFMGPGRKIYKLVSTDYAKDGSKIIFRRLEEVHLPNCFVAYLTSRFVYLRRLPEMVKARFLWAATGLPSVEILLGKQSRLTMGRPKFPVSINMLETLNGVALLFATNGFPEVRPRLHAEPEPVSDQILLRYYGPREKSEGQKPIVHTDLHGGLLTESYSQ